MQFDIRSFLESGRKPFEAHFEADFSKADFGGLQRKHSGSM